MNTNTTYLAYIPIFIAHIGGPWVPMHAVPMHAVDWPLSRTGRING